MNGQVNFAITSPCSYNDAKVLLAITPSGIDAWPRYWPIISILHLKYSCCHPWSRGFNSRRRLILQSHTCLKSKVSIKNSITNNNYTFQNYSLLPQNQALLLKNQDLLLAKIASIEEAIRDRLPNGKFGARDVVFAKMLKERPAIVISHSALTLLKRCKNSLSRLNIAFCWRTSARGLSMEITSAFHLTLSSSLKRLILKKNFDILSSVPAPKVQNFHLPVESRSPFRMNNFSPIMK